MPSPLCLLPSTLQVHVVRMLVALLEYAAARDFDLPPPALEQQFTAKPRPKRQQDLLPELDPLAELNGPQVGFSVLQLY